MEVAKVLQIIESTEVPAGNFPVGSEWVIHKVKEALVAAISAAEHHQ